MVVTGGTVLPRQVLCLRPRDNPPESWVVVHISQAIGKHLLLVSGRW
jgi:hypothetical protein